MILIECIGNIYNAFLKITYVISSFLKKKKEKKTDLNLR